MKKRIYIIFSIIIAIMCATLVKIELQNDTFSAIKIGDYILKHGVDFVEHFNMNPNLNYHNARWLFNVILAVIYNNFNFIGIYIFTIIISIIIGLTVFNVLYKYNKSLVISLVITILTMAYMSGYICARAQTVSYLLFFFEIYFIEKLLSREKIKYSIYIIICSILVANIHTTVWPITLVIFMPYFAEYFLSKLKIIKKSKRLYSDIKSVKLLIITFIITVISGLATPLGLLPYTYMFKTIFGISSKFIMELQSVNVLFEFRMLLLLAVYVFLIIYVRKKIKISDLFMVIGFFILGVLAYRNIPFFIILCSISLSRLIMNALEDKRNILDKIENRIINDKFILIIIIFYIIFISSVNFFAGIFNKSFVDEKNYPVDASTYLLENVDIDNMRLYTDFNYGSYVEFRGMKVFVDSRSEVYCKEFNDTTILEDYYNLVYFKDYYKDILNKYNFTHLLLINDTPLENYVRNDSDYKSIYIDKYFVIYEKVE